MKNFSSHYRGICFAIVSLLFVSAMGAQSNTLIGKKLSTKYPALNESFAEYEVFELDITKLQALTRSGNAFEFSLQLDQQNWEVYLEHNDLRGPNYREVAITDRGNEILPPRPNVTFKGRTGTDDTRFTITEDYLITRLVSGDNIYYLEPLSRLIDGMPKNQYVFYEINDILTDPELECVHNAGKRYAVPHPDDPKGTTDPLKMMECLEVEMATAGDFTMFNRYGSVMAVNDFILNVTNLMEPLYDDFSLSFLIVDQFVATTLASDPFDAAGDEAFDILDAFRPWAGANFVPHDLGQLWTAKDIRGCNEDDDDDDSTNFSLIGCADAIGDVCGSNRYNVCEDFSNSSNCLRALSAHEIGHVFNGVHSEANNSTIMFGNIVCGATTWTAGNITRIQNHIDSRDCLGACGACNIDLLVIISRETCPGEDDGFITGIVAGNAGLVTYVLTGPVNDSNTTGLFGPVPPGDYTLRAQDDGGGLNCFDEVNFSVDPSPDTAPPTNSCGDFSQSYEACPFPIGPNGPNGTWFTVGADLSFVSTAGGIYNQVVNLDGCVSDLFTSLADIEISLIASYTEGICPKTVVNEFIMRDECDNVSTDRIVVRHVFSESIAPVWDLSCQIDAVFTTEDGNVCPADATISLSEGDELTINDGWTVGGIPILPLNGCVEDECTNDLNLVILVDDITIVDDGTCSRTITVTFLAIDLCGNTSLPFVCNYTFIDDTGPEVSFNGIPNGGTYVIECDLPSTTWDPLTDIGELTISDNCSAIDFAGITEVLTQLYDGPCVGNMLTRWQQVFTVPDVCGNTTVYTLFTEIIDTTPPVFSSSPADVTIECDETAPLPLLEAFDSCSEVVYGFTEVRTDGSCPHNYTLTRTWTATDGCGNASNEVQVVTVEDTTPPVIVFVDEYVSAYTPGQDVFIECSEYGNISQIIASAASAVDNCSGSVPTTYNLQDLGSFDCAEFGYSGHLISTWRAVDECGNESSATINWFLVDETAPVFQGLPADACASLDDLPPVANVQAVDDCELAVLTFNQSDPIDCDGGQYIERTWNAEDACGNSASYTQRISLNGTNGPTITIDYPEIGDVMDGDLIQLPVDCDQDIAFSAAALEAAISVGAGCGSGSSSIELSLMDEGDCQENGYFARYRLNVTATDACGNTSSLSITIDFVDMTPPVVSSPNELTLNCGDEIPMIDATDACGEIASMTFVDSAPIEVSCAANPVAYDRTWTVTDNCGNATTFTQSIIVLDNSGPVFSGVPSDMCNNTGIDVLVTAIDGCTGQQAQVNFNEVMSNQAGCGQVLTRTWTATDACGNTSVATQQVFFTDAVAPTIAFTSDLLFGLESGDDLFLNVGDGFGDPGDPLLLTASDVTVTDNCATLTAQVQMETTISLDCVADGYLARYDYRFTATDPCGNTNVAKLTVFYVDGNAPDFFNVPGDLEVFCAAVPPVADVIASDDYDEEVDVVFSETHTPTAEGILITRTWTATDDCGNVNEVSQEILVVNNDLDATFSFASPVIVCNSDDNRLGVTPTGGTPPYTYQWQLTDPLEDGYITTDPTRPAILFTMGYITQTFTVLITDANGCEYAASVTVVCDFSDDEGDFTGGGNDQLSLNVYPNPTNEQLMVKARVQEDIPVTVALYNLFGQELFRKELDTWAPEGLSIDTRRFPNGTYLLRLTADGQEVQTREVVILH